MSLKNLIDSIDWLQITPTSRGYVTKLSTKDVGIKFKRRSTTDSAIEKISLRFGKDILETLGWQEKDRLVIYNDPDDLLTFLICKSENGLGYAIGIDKKGKGHGRISFLWPHTKLLRLKELQIDAIQYEIYKNYISFRAEKPRND